MNKLWIRLTLAFTLVTITGLIVASILSNRQVSTQFRQFIMHNQMMSPVIAATLTDYYAQKQTWAEVQSIFSSLPGPMMGQGRGRRMGGPGIILADADGLIVHDSTRVYPQAHLSRQDQAAALLLTLNNQTIGYLLLKSPGNLALAPADQAFLDQVNQALYQAGLIAAGLGLVIGVMIARGLSAPLSQLAAATQRIAKGDFTQKVTPQGSDEISRLARSFNEMTDHLQQAEQLRRNMIADIAHELRTPLSVIRGNLQAIIDGVFPLDEAEIIDIFDETVMLQRLVDDLHDLAQIEAGQLTLNPTQVDINSLSQQAVNLFEGVAQEKQITLKTALPTSLTTVQADPDRTKQIVHNLLANALQHTPQNGSVKLSVEQLASAHLVKVSVTDTGPGIPEADQPHVFERFWRADKSRARHKGGAGLGLAIVKQLVEAQGGQVDVESQRGHGSCFWFTLPISAHI